MAVIWDFECPECLAEWNNDGDPYGDGDEGEEQCPKCGLKLIVTASISIDYDVRIAEENKTEDK